MPRLADALASWIAGLTQSVTVFLNTFLASNPPPTSGGGSLQIGAPLQTWLISYLVALSAGVYGYVAQNPPPAPVASASPSPAPSVTALPSPSPTPAATPAPIFFSPSTLVFGNPSSPAQNVAVSEARNTGAYTVSAAPNGVVTVSISGSGPTAVLAVAPVASGSGGTSANITVFNASGQSAVLPVGVGAAPTPGPIAAQPNDVSFANPGAPTQSVNVTDPGNTTALAVTGGGGVVTTTTSGGPTNTVISITPVSPGNASLVVSDGTRTANITANVGALVLPPTTYTNLAPGVNYPYQATVPIAAHSTFTAVVTCPANPAGNALISGLNTFALEAGQCNGSLNTGSPEETHAYDQVGGQQALPPNDLLNAQYYMLGESTDGTNVNYFSCSLPYTTNNCVENSTPDKSSWTPGNMTEYIGAGADGSARLMSPGGLICDLKNYGSALTLAQVNLRASTASICGYISNVIAAPESLTFTAPNAASQNINTTGGTGPLIVTNLNGIVTANVSRYNVIFSPLSEGTTTATITDGTSSDQIAITVQKPVTQPGKFVAYTNYWTAKTPFHDTVAQLRSAGGSDDSNSSVIMGNVFCCGINNVLTQNPNKQQPFNVGLASSPFLTINTDPGNAAYSHTSDVSNTQVHYPNPLFSQQANSDHHVVVMDQNYGPAGPGGAEVDLFGAKTPGCAISGSTINCFFGGYYAFSGDGSAYDGPDRFSNGDAAGYAFGILYVTAQDLLTATQNNTTYGTITHALGTSLHCGSNTGGIYPSFSGMDNKCGAITDPSTSTQGQNPSPVYGDMFYLNSSFTIPPTASNFCKSILATLQTYGLYFYDTGPYQYNGGMEAQVESPLSNAITNPNDPNPWYNTIEPDLVAHNEGSNPGTGFSWNICSQYTNKASYWTVFRLNQAGKSALP